MDGDLEVGLKTRGLGFRGRGIEDLQRLNTLFMGMLVLLLT